jgi:N-acetylglutamate synthase-like GNAT family acetyltransferase
MGVRLEIRTASADDLPAVRDLFTEYARSLSYHICFESFEKELAALPAGYLVILLAVVDGQLAGCVAVRTLAGDTCEMKRLYVRETSRGTGAGRRLVERAIAWARNQGFRTMRLDTLPDKMTSAISLYRSLGFQEIGREGEKLDMELRLTGDDLEVAAQRA